MSIQPGTHYTIQNKATKNVITQTPKFRRGSGLCGWSGMPPATLNPGNAAMSYWHFTEHSLDHYQISNVFNDGWRMFGWSDGYVDVFNGTRAPDQVWQVERTNDGEYFKVFNPTIKRTLYDGNAVGQTGALGTADEAYLFDQDRFLWAILAVSHTAA